MSDPYSSPEDLLLGNIPLRDDATQLKYCSDATDEIDSTIGFLYETPVDMTDDPGTVARPSRLLLKRINNFIASGRLILAYAAGTEDDNLNAYAQYLLGQARDALMKIASGDIVLQGAVTIGDGSENPVSSGPLFFNLDPESNVEAFYDRIVNPNYCFKSSDRVIFGSGG